MDVALQPPGKRSLHPHLRDLVLLLVRSVSDGKAIVKEEIVRGKHVSVMTHMFSALNTLLKRAARPSLACLLAMQKLASMLLISVVGSAVATLVAYSLWRRFLRGERGSEKKKGKRVCVVGGGIAGVSTAWALQRSGFAVSLHESKNYIGGNAKSHEWTVGDKKVTTGLSVLAWPGHKFHNYSELMSHLEVPVVSHDLRFFVGSLDKTGTGEDDHSCVYAHGRASHTPEQLQRNQPWLAADLRRWKRCVNFIRGTNDFFAPSPHRSIYRSSKLNPLNLISLWTVCRIFGISRKFWDTVFVPVHTSTFLETHMDGLPAVIGELLEDIVPLSDPSAYPVMETWVAGHAREVFEKLLAPMRKDEHCSVHVNNGVASCEFVKREDGEGTIALVRDEDGNIEEFDHVVFACGAPAVARITRQFSVNFPSFGGSLWALMAHWMLKQVLSRIKYTESRDQMFVRGSAHSDSARVLPKRFEAELLEDYCNYVEVQEPAEETNGSIRYENSFILSSWCPPTRVPGVKGKRAMLVSYNCEERLDGGAIEHYERNVTGREAHPCLTMTNLALSNVVWPWLQGMHGGCAYFCGSFVTPGNGHDLSMLSGLVVANAVGAEYPFKANERANSDFGLCQKLMGLS